MTASLTTYLDLGRDQANRALVRARPARAAPRVTVAALSGLHAGQATTPEGDAFLISGEDGSHVFLLDPELEGIILHVRAERSMVGPFVRIETNATTASVGGVPLKAGRLSAPHRLPTELQIGAVRLALSGAAPLPVAIDSPAGAATGTALSIVPATAPTERPYHRWRTVIATLLSVSLVGAGWFADRREADASPLMLASATAPSARATQSPDATDPRNENALSPAAPKLHAMIAGSPLDAHLQTSTRPDGAFVVRGEVPEGMMPLWQEMHRRHDADAGPPLVALVRALPPLSAFPAIATVRHGENAVVIFSDGTRAQVGTKIDGWTLDKIEPGALTLSRAGDVEILTY